MAGLSDAHSCVFPLSYMGNLKYSELLGLKGIGDHCKREQIPVHFLFYFYYLSHEVNWLSVVLFSAAFTST
jgi:hypothetical protein